ncbi:hypothetical protein DPMN_094311 [Dreissena polymorpha]|uniref:Uncharacterized protein n=1 Tax=Dreissena polymorpha TaxID=45954 RepID=A0A9D4L5W3_DREPO|nr:hypothetical protein DPMN_094311 [Dreissena polymorpha]
MPYLIIRKEFPLMDVNSPTISDDGNPKKYVFNHIGAKFCLIRQASSHVTLDGHVTRGENCTRANGYPESLWMFTIPKKKDKTPSDKSSNKDQKINKGHKLDPNNTKILAPEDWHIKRRVKEAINIKQRRPSLNRDEGLELSPVYNSLLVSRDNPTSRDSLNLPAHR